MSKEELLFCPLGGSGQIGGNMNLYAYGKEENQKWIIVDTGVSFADDSVPGIDLIYPDPGFIIDKKDDLLGIVLTHAHEDHIGAISHIWPDLKCNIYATPFTAVLITEKFKEKKIDISSNLKIIQLNGKNCKIVLTGGYSYLFKKRLYKKAKIEKDITMHGIVKIYRNFLL